MNRLYLAILCASAALLIVAAIAVTPSFDTKTPKPVFRLTTP